MTLSWISREWSGSKRRRIDEGRYDDECRKRRGADSGPKAAAAVNVFETLKQVRVLGYVYISLFMNYDSFAADQSPIRDIIAKAYLTFFPKRFKKITWYKLCFDNITML